jgi:alcohol dehydrogenase YqhD (iron-dependent ADH family)
LVLNSFTFYNPTRIQFGKGSISQIGREIEAAGYKKVLLIAGGGSIRANGVYDTVSKSLKDSKISFVEGWGVQANPNLEKVRDLILLAQAEGVDALLAVGGGSVIDTTKAVAAGFYLKDVWNAFTRREAIAKALPVYTVLTLSATGSEMNGNAVITNEAERLKWAISSPLLYPKLTIIDPTAQSSLPFRQTVNGALDAIAHILEYYFADQGAWVTLGINDSLMRTIIKCTDLLKENPNDLVARSNLAWSATLALNGISGVGLKGGDWACHGIEHALSAFNPRIAHGEGLGVIFPAWIEFMADRNPAAYYRWAKNVWNEDSPSKGVLRFREKIESWDSALSLRDLGLKEEDLPQIMDIISATPILGSISRFGAAEVESLLMLSF